MGLGGGGDTARGFRLALFMLWVRGPTGGLEPRCIAGWSGRPRRGRLCWSCETDEDAQEAGFCEVPLPAFGVLLHVYTHILGGVLPWSPRLTLEHFSLSTYICTYLTLGLQCACIGVGKPFDVLRNGVEEVEIPRRVLDGSIRQLCGCEHVGCHVLLGGTANGPSAREVPRTGGR